MTFKFNKHQREWIDALKDGEWNQVEGVLFSSGGYCCLGVACSLQGVEDNTLEDVMYDDLTLFPEIKNSLGLWNAEGKFFVSNKNKRWLEEKEVEVFRKDLSLVDLNDTYRLSFSEIAEYLETFPEDVFRGGEE